MGCCCCCKAKESEEKVKTKKKEGCCCYCMRRSCCRPCEMMGFKTEDKFAEKMDKAKMEKLKTKHKVRSFRLGSARMGVCFNGLLGMVAPCYCFLVISNKRQCTVVCGERRILERAAKENHSIDLRKGENRVGRKRYLLLGALCRLCISVACLCVGELVNECAISQVESCFECAAKAPLEGPGGDVAKTLCLGAGPLTGLSSGKVVELGVQAAVKERGDNKAEIEVIADK